MFKSIGSFLRILFLLSTLIDAEDTFDCTGYEDDSYHPVYDADDCRHYWHCIYVNTVYMHAVKRVCPAGTEFDIALRQCETASQVDCLPIRSPHVPRTTSTTKAWRWKYSKLFSRIQLKPTIPSFGTTRRHPVFDLGDALDIETTAMIIPEMETTERIQVLPLTLLETTTAFSLEQLSKNLHALVSKHHPSKSKLSGAKFFQPGEPENEAEVYTSTTKRRTRPIQPTASFPQTTLLFTTETITTTIATTSTTTLSTTSPLPSPAITTDFDTTINLHPQARMIGMNARHRRKNMTLYILTSDEHKIRQFSMNHTRGILINCNQLRRRLLGRRRRLRDITSTPHSLIEKNGSRENFPNNILLLTIISHFFLQK